MRSIFLISSLSSIILACPPEILNNGTQSGMFPTGNQTSNTGLKLCTMTLTVPKGYYLEVLLNNTIGSNGFSLVTDAVGAIYFDSGVNVLLFSADYLQIQLNTAATGVYSFSWTYHMMTSKPTKYLTLPENGQGLLIPQSTTFDSQVVVRSNGSLAIFGDANPETYIENQNLQACFVFAGEGVAGQYLGSLYTLMINGLNIEYMDSPYTITLVSYSSNSISGAFLVRLLFDIQTINYRFKMLDEWPYSENITLTSTANKPAVLTVYDPNSHYGCYLYTQSFSSSTAQLNWLPGSATPPTAPNLSFNKNTAIIPPKIPGPSKTFVVTNGTVSFTLSSNYPEKYQNLEVGDVAYFATEYYSLENSEQDLFETCFMKALAVGKVTFDIEKAYARFNITVTDGKVATETLSSSDPTVTFNGKGFRIMYMGANDAKDTGGLLKLEVKSSLLGSNLMSLLIPIVIILCKFV